MRGQAIKENLNRIRSRIEAAALACGRDPHSVKLVAVSKTRPAEDIREAAQCGATLFGENYVKEAAGKIETLKDLGVSFHFIGHLQSNKAKNAVQMFDVIHSVDSVNLAFEINRHAKRIGKIQDILIQVNTGMEESKSGIHDRDVERMVRDIAVLENVHIRGLMTIPPFDIDQEAVRPYFRELREASERVKAMGIPCVSMDDLSMGMTGDFETAIQEGSTYVRIGNAIFGERS
jgi:pyridoxal phosphate enzyme (YggS family)